VIDEIIQHIIDSGFCLVYAYEPILSQNVHRFIIKRRYGEREFNHSWMLSDEEFRSMHKGVLLMIMDRHMEEINNAITQHRLIEEALS